VPSLHIITRQEGIVERRAARVEPEDLNDSVIRVEVSQQPSEPYRDEREGDTFQDGQAGGKRKQRHHEMLVPKLEAPSPLDRSPTRPEDSPDDFETERWLECRELCGTSKETPGRISRGSTVLHARIP